MYTKNPIALVDLDWNNKELIEDGCFGGEVYETTWSHTDKEGKSAKETVAVVDLKNEPRDRIFYERDVKSNLCHKKIVVLLGWTQITHLQHPMLVFEHSKDQDLWSYLHLYSDNEITFGVMKKMAFDIARGMEYLHYKQVIHGDLALRNCTVYTPEKKDDIWEVKVGDNAYYNTDFEGCYYNQPGHPIRCPVRWMSPENLPFRFHDEQLVPTDHKKSSEGDVWAFGVVLFEIWTEGEFPFGGLTDKEVCRRVLTGCKATGYARQRLKKEMDTIWQLMHSCWQPNPKDRPKFSTIVSSLEEREGCQSSSEEEESDGD